jgi:hypothetical protein
LSARHEKRPARGLCRAVRLRHGRVRVSLRGSASCMSAC